MHHITMKQWATASAMKAAIVYFKTLPLKVSVPWLATFDRNGNRFI